MDKEKMKDMKVVPIRRKHQSFNSLAGEAMDTKEWVRGMFVAFEEDGTMHFGEYGMLTSDVGMAVMMLNKVSVDMMES